MLRAQSNVFSFSLAHSETDSDKAPLQGIRFQSPQKSSQTLQHVKSPLQANHGENYEWQSRF